MPKTDQEAIERAYGALWLAPSDDGRVIKARKLLLPLLDVEGNSRRRVRARRDKSMQWHSHREIAAQSLTGRVRGRAGWFGKVVMQVEVLSPKPAYPNPAKDSVWAFGRYAFWRDATIGDADVIERDCSEGVIRSKYWR